jgi:hypothetical protein
MLKDNLGFVFYTGKLNLNKLTQSSELELKSFIAGKFLIRGNKKHDNFLITVYSPLGFECLKKVLEILDCEIKHEKIVEGISPSYTVIFKPKTDLKDILDNEILRRNTLANSGE